MQNEDYESKVYKPLKDLNWALACIDYGYDYDDIIKEYGCKTLKEFIDFVFVNILRKYLHIC